MNKLYILGALLLSSAEAGKIANVITATTSTNALFGSYTYTVSGDCVPTTGTTLGLNNKYYQYYSFPIAVGSQAWSVPAPVAVPANYQGIFKYNACYHTHLANWMATPAITTVGVQGGLGNQAVAYGYVLSGTAVTACTNSIATATLYSATAKTFSGAQYQTSYVYLTAASSTAAQTTITYAVRVKQGLENYDTVTVKASASVEAFTITPPATSSTGEAMVTTSTAATNYYWDFMQTNVFQGMTQFGRGGGSTTAPCGWYVVYALEAPGAVTGSVASYGITASTGFASTEDVLPTLAGVTVSMWTDNSILTFASSIVLSALATILF